MLKLKIILLLFPITILSQSVSGIIYDANSTVKGANVFNKTQNTMTYTNENGRFEISAKVNDTLVIGSLFHKEQQIAITKQFLKTELVIELKKIINTLDEVFLESTSTEKPFTIEDYTVSLKEQIEIDKKNNPEKYSPASSGNIDFVKIAKLIGRLFKKRETFKAEPFTRATYKDFENLFATDYLINYSFLVNDLKIESKYHSLFFDFCDTQNIDNKLLHKDKQLLLIETLYKCSSDFLKIISEVKKD